MPYAPAKSCAIPGCREYRAADAKYCARHAQQFADNEQDRRGTAAQRGYGARWARYRRAFLSAHPICAAPECGRAATDVDHITAVRGPNDPLFWEPSNHQGLCHSCHSRKTATENGGFGNVK